MIKSCPVCGDEFKTRNGRKYCSDSCRKAAELKRAVARDIAAHEFIKEWWQWRHDFALGKTVSNVRSELHDDRPTPATA